MELRDVEKLKHAYERIRVLDGEIVEIEKMAMLISEKRTEIAMSFIVTDLDDKVKKKLRFDEDGSIVQEGRTGGLFDFMMPSTPKEEHSSDTVLRASISDTIALRLLGELYASKDAERKEILKYFRELEVKS